MNELSEKQLIDLCIKGNRKAQKTIYDRLAGKMFSVCIRYVVQRDVAEDLLQDGFVTLFSKLDTYKGDGSFEGWARRIFVTTSLMYLRKKDVLKMSEDLDNVRNMTSDYASQIQTMGYNELLALITQMPPGFRTVFNLSVLEGYSHKDIADFMNITETTSRTQLSRARIWLQNRIRENAK